jgi:hypothetical protein
MQSDFQDAHERHWEDAELMFNAGRWPNADHLHGVSAECGLKALMLKFGMNMHETEDKLEKKADRKHADEIWERYDTYRAGRPAGSDYDILADKPFDDWRIEQRYAHRVHFDEARAKKHRQGALAVRAVIRKARLDGIIP